jgi:surface antigen-like variable number repeat protein
MKPAAAVLYLLVTVTTVSAAPQVGENTGTPRAAHTPRVRAIRFAGDPAFDRDALKKVLQELESRRVIPGIWTRRPLYETRAVEADLARLRSFYFSQGYFDARVGVRSVTVDGDDAILTFEVQSGPKYAVRHFDIDGTNDDRGATATDSSGEFHVETLCKSLFDEKRIAESQGRLDFGVELEISHTDGPALATTGSRWVDLTLRVRPGSAYAVGRINFSGHHRINASTLRRAMALQERSPFDVGKLRASLARLNRSALFEPLTPGDVEIRTKPDTLTADLTVAIRERSGRRWSLSGPLGPSAFGLLEATISSRLPPWGRGIFEASTYYLTFSVTGFSNPLIRLLPIRIRPSPPALLVLERPYVAGQALLSGFAFSPQLSAPRLLAGYGLTHLDRMAQAALIGELPGSSELLIPISGRHTSGVGGGSEEASFVICNPPAPSHRRLRRAGAVAAGLVLGAFRPY